MRFAMMITVPVVLASVLVIAGNAQTVTAHHDHEASKAPATSGEMKDTKEIMSAEMEQRCRMMRTQINASDPAALLSISDELKLTPQQRQMLQAVLDNARQQARATLTAEQLKKVAMIPAEPDNSIAMHEHVAGAMQMDHQEKQKMECPMMKMMGEHAHAATTQPAGEAPAGADAGREGHHH